MEKVNIIWKKSIFTRLIVTFLFIIIPVYFMGINLYNWGISIVSEEVSNSMISQVTYYLNGLETDLQRIKALQYDCLNDDNLDKLANLSQLMNEYEKSVHILASQQRLNAIKSSSVYINDVCAFIPSFGKSISALGNVDDFDQEKFTMLNVYDTTSASQIMYKNKSLFLSATSPIPNLSGKEKPSFLIEIELSGAELKKALGQLNNYTGSGSILINQMNDYIIENASDKKVAEQVYGLTQKKINGLKSGKSFVKIEKKQYLIVFATSNYLNMSLIKYIPADLLSEPLKKYQVAFWLFSIVSVIIIVLFSVSTFRFIHRPLKKLVNSFQKLETGELNFSINHKRNDEFGYLYQQFNATMEKLNALIEQVYKQKILAQHAELKQLQAQINPHFLYNSFFILHRMIKLEDYKNSLHFSHQLGNYFRFITRSAADEVSLDREAEHARIYAEIQAMRFSNRICVEFHDVPDKYKEFMVPRLILQPLIENSIEHGLKNKEKDGIVRIMFNELADGLCITVEDNGCGVSDLEIDKLRGTLSNNENCTECTGVINIHQRLQLKFGPDSGLSIYQGELGGFKVEVNIILNVR